jgi:hypothetical protein
MQGGWHLFQGDAYGNALSETDPLEIRIDRGEGNPPRVVVGFAMARLSPCTLPLLERGNIIQRLRNVTSRCGKSRRRECDSRFLIGAILWRRINVIPPVQSPSQKHSCSHPTQITGLFLPSRPTGGRLAIVTNAGRDAVDADAQMTNSA